ncbi:MAG TPA: GNAT family N-acetyltransferase [Solirubrobacteraceae bacterium]|nr:GNAT family N-acetyltransferase [Solirubrobacteraceae bacterium]
MVRLATAEDVPALADALARAFDDDPLAQFASPRASSRPRRQRFFFAGRLRTLIGEEMTYCDPQRRGAALWAPPDRWHAPPREQVRLLRMLNHRSPWVAAGFARMERLHPREPHYYLSTLGVAPEAQGRGLGSALLEPMLERCDREGVPAYLESSKERNIAFYGRHGFRVTREMRFPRGPKLWLMWRDPR